MAEELKVVASGVERIRYQHLVDRVGINGLAAAQAILAAARATSASGRASNQGSNSRAAISAESRLICWSA